MGWGFWWALSDFGIAGNVKLQTPGVRPQTIDLRLQTLGIRPQTVRRKVARDYTKIKSLSVNNSDLL